MTFRKRETRVGFNKEQLRIDCVAASYCVNGSKHCVDDKRLKSPMVEFCPSEKGKHLSYIPALSECSVVGAKQLDYFSRAFIFENLPRGPPTLA
jgi:hypothetical protein